MKRKFYLIIFSNDINNEIENVIMEHLKTDTFRNRAVSINEKLLLVCESEYSNTDEVHSKLFDAYNYKKKSMNDVYFSPFSTFEWYVVQVSIDWVNSYVKGFDKEIKYMMRE